MCSGGSTVLLILTHQNASRFHLIGRSDATVISFSSLCLLYFGTPDSHSHSYGTFECNFVYAQQTVWKYSGLRSWSKLGAVRESQNLPLRRVSRARVWSLSDGEQSRYCPSLSTPSSARHLLGCCVATACISFLVLP
ncbi:hypothetical protein EJ05DRAFT_276501 [Pseudovirgaria hyperparasitica]|uniref:Uncharacterized protein n=1 Tax=Pseudovirgaria hyperparasitica TaxID=470096 RepID=A0A6A6WDV2_9PEZI|nr:uncharacterized protein EJ05DRAFT_276501 [Pseudovirgaria hyperparasitica]KAF2760234.1 hypothetical protein EJ05DRAFT_276501 [Pseudovirgaria hyperparasitica]